LWPVIDEMDNTVIKARRIAQMVELGVDFGRVGSMTVEGHAEYEFDGLTKRLSGSRKGVLRQITATQDLPKTNTRVGGDLDEAHCRVETLLAGFSIALQVKERFASDQEAGGALLSTVDVQQVGLGQRQESWVILQVLIAQRSPLEQACLVGRRGGLLVCLLPGLPRGGMVLQAGLSLGQHFE